MVLKLLTRALVSFSFIGLPHLMAVNPASTKYLQQSQSQVYSIGQYAQGGVIFWLTPDLQHGLVASIVDMTNSPILWSPAGAIEVIGAVVNDISFGANYTTAGKINTSLIVANYGPGNTYAAGVCDGYSITVDSVTYSDWYLPCLAELALMRSQKSIINTTLSTIGGADLFQEDFYWSSYLYMTLGAAWVQNFSDTDTDSQGFADIDSQTNYVRAVRAF